MKNRTHFLGTAYIIASLSLYSCGGGEGNTGNKITEIDSTRDSTVILQHEDIPDPDEHAAGFATGNAVKVELANTSSFKWEDFRNELSAKEEAIGEGFRQGNNYVATAWEKLNDRYSYQTVYHYREGELWLQTYYRGNNPTSATDSLSKEEGQLLTKEDANNPEYQDMWNRMEEKALNLVN